MPITVKQEPFTEALARRSWTLTHFAAETGLHQLTVERVASGAPTGEKFIAAALVAFPELEFADLFEIVTPGPDAAAQTEPEADAVPAEEAVA